MENVFIQQANQNEADVVIKFSDMNMRCLDT